MFSRFVQIAFKYPSAFISSFQTRPTPPIKQFRSFHATAFNRFKCPVCYQKLDTNHHGFFHHLASKHDPTPQGKWKFQYYRKVMKQVHYALQNDIPLPNQRKAEGTLQTLEQQAKQ